jgi:large subunit ribosomal protein L1
MKFRGKNYKKSLDSRSKKTSFSIPEAVGQLKEAASGTKFDSTAELHIRLNIDPKKADQQIRSTIALPHGSGKKVKVAALVNDDKVAAAKAAGADAAGLEDLIDEFSKGKINYDVIVATPDVMKKLGKVAKTLGQKGLMPNPKSGTVAEDVEEAIKKIKAGQIEYRNDKSGIVHTVFGKASFKADELENNLKSILRALRDNKPSAIKGTFIKSISISGTMTPGYDLDVNEALKSL